MDNVHKVPLSDKMLSNELTGWKSLPLRQKDTVKTKSFRIVKEQYCFELNKEHPEADMAACCKYAPSDDMTGRVIALYTH